LYTAWFFSYENALPSLTKRRADAEWVKTPYSNLIRYKPSGNYFGRVRVNGKLIRRSLETRVLTVAKLKLSDFLQDHRRLAVNKGQSVNGDVIIETSGAGQAKDCANLFRFLAFSGLRIDEARHVLWNDLDFDKGLLHARITKNGKDREIPLNSSLRQLFEQMRLERPKESPDKSVMQVFECQKSIDRAARLVGAKRITHHDLRHLFATRCIEAGVDIPTVSRWLGHQDGGALCMKTYGHLRDEHGQREALKVSF